MSPMNTGWSWVIERVLGMRARKNLRVQKSGLPNPLDAGFRLSSGLPKMQVLDYRWALPDGRGIHIRDYVDEYEVHWDQHDPSVNLWAHLIVDVPRPVKVAAGTLAAAGLAWLAMRKK